MTRLIFPKGEQKRLLDEIIASNNTNSDEIGKICGVSGRTIRDWRREKYTISEIAIELLQQKYHIKIAPIINKVSDYWYVIKGAKKGALKRLEKYGPPGTLEGRKKGGRIAQQRRKEQPDKYRLLGCNVRKEFKLLYPNIELAETVGIILGDGGITNYQLKIYLDRFADREYAEYVRSLFHRVFGEYPSAYYYKKKGTLELLLSGANLVENLNKIGINKGNKIRNQVDFPEWIWKQKRYQRYCVRGLVDTDGGLYFHRHSIKGSKYINLGLCFTSWSRLLIKSVGTVLRSDKIKFSVVNNNRIYIYSLVEIEKYFRLFGSSNPKILDKLESFHSKSRKIGKRATK